ncbi:ArsR/SmtB family transcription factor [Allonocardiopsis opalescens]|uniref:DNA-binding transcriptional ArsR family regulator n=1 Tax=Allonocardiopsis opalescens TaxID=1144618 RepID=A0A2T0QE13_9ACTN|nr:metalloregulator ArsR/SmtB family transcription factor [Allonocardiopsis opalescens]PRY02186.1 DNA-binding transcriptional ArsR family regulator [Allonocardiopsis opalescens]
MTDPRSSEPSAPPEPGPPAAPQVPVPPVEPEVTPPQLRAAANTFGLLAAPTRLHLVWILARHECDVGTLAERTGATVAAVSQHLAKLRLAGLVTARRVGRHQIYAVEDPHVLTLVQQIFAHIAPDGGLAPDPPSPRHPAREAAGGDPDAPS